MSTQIVRYVSVASQKQYQGLAPWTPAEISVAAWWDASDLATIAEDTSPGFVSQWDDKSGNDSHMVQGTGASQPTTGNLTQNGLNLIRFDNQKLANANVFNGYAGDNYTMVYVARPKDYNTYTTGRLFNIGGTNHRVYPCISGTDAWRWTLTGLYGAVVYPSNYSTLEENLITSMEAVQSGGDWTRSVYKNGEFTSDDGPTTAGTIGNSLEIGSVNDGADNFVDMAIGELVVLADGIDTEKRQLIEGYLAHKWGLAGLLPSDHPWKNAMPYVMG